LLHTRSRLWRWRGLAGGITAPVTNVVSTVTVTITRPDLLASNPIVVVDTLPGTSHDSIARSAAARRRPARLAPATPGSDHVVDPKPRGAGTQVYNLYITTTCPA